MGTFIFQFVLELICRILHAKNTKGDVADTDVGNECFSFSLYLQLGTYD